MSNEQRTPAMGDRIECNIHTPSTNDHFTWYKAKICGVRDGNFDVLFDEPAGPHRIRGGLFHNHHEGTNWRYDSSPEAPAPEEQEAAEEPKADDVSDA